MSKPKLIRITTVPLSMDKLLEGQLKYMSDDFDITAISSDDNGYLEKVANRENVNFKPVELTRAITPLADLNSLRKMVSAFKEIKPDIVHTHTPKAGVIGLWAAKLANVPTRLHTVAGLPLMEATGKKRLLLNTVEKYTYSAAQKVYPNSYGLKDIILEEGFAKEDKLKVLGNGSTNGIDTSLFSLEKQDSYEIQKLKHELGISADDFVYIFVGRLVTDKGIVELAEAFKEIETKHPNAKLLLVGPFEPELDPLPTATVEYLKSSKNIILTGYKNDVKPYFAISNLLVFPSYREGFPNVVMQAGSMELPAIVSNINGCNEIITEDENGWIVEPKDSKTLFLRMNEAYLNRSVLKSIGKQARSNIILKYEQKVIWKAIKTEYFDRIQIIKDKL